MKFHEINLGIEIDETVSISGNEMVLFIEQLLVDRVNAMKNFMMHCNNELPMMFDLVTTDRQVISICPQTSFMGVEKLDETAIKAVSQELIKTILKSNPIAVVIHVAEGWVCGLVSPEEAESYRAIHGPVRNWPGSKEVFFAVACYNVNGNPKSIAHIVPIINHDNGTRSLDEKDHIVKKDRSTVNLFDLPCDLMVPLEIVLKLTIREIELKYGLPAIIRIPVCVTNEKGHIFIRGYEKRTVTRRLDNGHYMQKSDESPHLGEFQMCYTEGFSEKVFNNLEYLGKPE